MTAYSLAPHWVEHNYIVDGEQHTITHSVDIADDSEGLTNYQLNTKDGTGIAFASFVLGFGDVWKTQYNVNDSAYIGAWLYRQLPTDVEPIPLDQSATLIIGTSAGATVKASQMSYNFFDQRRKRLRLTLINGIGTPFTRQSYAELAPAGQALVDFCIGDSTAMMTRAGRFLDGFGTRTVTYNDKLTKKYYTVK